MWDISKLIPEKKEKLHKEIICCELSVIWRKRIVNSEKKGSNPETPERSPALYSTRPHTARVQQEALQSHVQLLFTSMYRAISKVLVTCALRLFLTNM